MLLRAATMALATMAAATLLAAAPGPAGCTVEEITDPVTGEVILRETCPQDGEGGSGDDGGPDGGGSGVTCTQEYWPSPPEPLFTWWRNIEDRGEDGVWGEGSYSCSDGSTRSWASCYARCDDAPEPDWQARLDALVLEAVERVDPPLPGVRHSFDQPAANGQVRAVVQAEVWWWAEADFEPVVVNDRDGPVWVEITAAPGELIIDPGDGTAPFACAAPGVAWDQDRSYYEQVPGADRGACVHVYERAADMVTATVTVEWTLTYEGFAPAVGDVEGTLPPVPRQQQVSFPVRELQSVIVD